jgi:AAA ATPase domain
MVDSNDRATRLIGRDRELAALDSFLGNASTSGATLVLAGEPGVGKTALLLATSEKAATDGFRVIQGGGVEYESDISFAALHQLVDHLSDELEHIPRTNRIAIEVALGMGSGPAPDRLAVLTASLALFRQAATSAPLLIVVDDLHWLDRSSGGVVGFVGRRLHGSRIGLIGAMRPGFGGFFERVGLPDYAIGPLADSEAIELLTRRGTRLSVDGVDRPLCHGSDRRQPRRPSNL